MGRVRPGLISLVEDQRRKELKMVAISPVGTPNVPLPPVPANTGNPQSAKDAAPAEPQSQQTPQDTPYVRNRDKFLGLAKIIINADGKASLDDRLKAFSSYWGMLSNGELFGSDKECQDLVDQIDNADFNQRAEHLRIQVMVTELIAHEQGKNATATGLQWFASLSEDDQKTF